MTFKVTVVYQAGFKKTVMTQEMSGVEKVERTWEKVGGENVEVLRVYDKGHSWRTWGVGGILNINMVPEFKTE
jgi:hypothetical protein